jgi:hypothetical protein
MGRTVLLHPQEGLRQAARAFQRSHAFVAVRRRRQAAEHRLPRLVQLGLRQARYIGRTKTLFQLALAAAVANLTLLAGRAVAHRPQAGAVSGPSSAAAVLTVAVLVLLLALLLAHTRV